MKNDRPVITEEEIEELERRQQEEIAAADLARRAQAEEDFARWQEEQRNRAMAD